MIDDMWGYIKTDGSILTPAVFALLWDYQEDMARVAVPMRGVGFLNGRGQKATPFKFIEVRNFSNGLAAFEKWN
jgi:hypothetical protein